MSKYSKFESLLRELEKLTVSKKQIRSLCDYFKNNNIHLPLFDSYLHKRLEDNIHPERLLNMASHVEKDEKIRYLSRTINEKIVKRVMNDNKNFDQFYFMMRHDFRDENHIFNSFVEQFKNYRNSDSLEMLDKVCHRTGIDKYIFMLKAMSTPAIANFNSYSNMDLFGKLATEEQYLLLIRALETNNPGFINLISWCQKSMLNSLENQLDDNNQLAIALRNTLISTSQLESCTVLNEILLPKYSKLPKTLASLYSRAEQEECWTYLLFLGLHKNKKELLGSIVKSKDQKIINEFFSIYKNSPEVKHLVPFI